MERDSEKSSQFNETSESFTNEYNASERKKTKGSRSHVPDLTVEMPRITKEEKRRKEKEVRRKSLIASQQRRVRHCSISLGRDLCPIGLPWPPKAVPLR